MRGARVKMWRRFARAACDASITSMQARGYKREAVFAKDQNGKPIIQNEKAIEIHPERFVYTAFWPRNSFRRIMRELKRGKNAGYPANVPAEA